jgi:hypothetical protein
VTHDGRLYFNKHNVPVINGAPIKVGGISSYTVERAVRFKDGRMREMDRPMMRSPAAPRPARGRSMASRWTPGFGRLNSAVRNVAFPLSSLTTLSCQRSHLPRTARRVRFLPALAPLSEQPLTGNRANGHRTRIESGLKMA